MSEQFEQLRLGLSYKSTSTEQIFGALWRRFLARVAVLDYTVDRSVWICNRFPAWIGVKPGSFEDDPCEEPQFVISTEIDNLDAMRDQIRNKHLIEADYFREMEVVYSDYYNWLQSAIRKSFLTEDVQALLKNVIQEEFGVYSTQIDDLHTSELDEMDWLAGDDLRT